MVKNLPAKAGDMGCVSSISGLGKSPEVGMWKLILLRVLVSGG